jgi:hypothetical protein
MPMERATDKISDAGKRTMLQGFAAGKTAACIVQAVKDETGEELAERTVARRAAEWRQEMADRKARREHMSDLVAAMREQGMDGTEMIQALAIDHLVEHPEALTGADPIELHGLQLDAKKVQLKEREIAVRERVAAIDERKMALLEDREQRAIKLLKAEGGERQMTPEERIQEIRSIYGIAG